jgi:hypothetical protein
MSPPKLNPLNQDHCDCLTGVLGTGPGLTELIQCLNDCGVDTTELNAINQQQQTMASQLKAKFFPSKP